MATLNYDPNARYDQGQNAAGSNGVWPSLGTDAFILRALGANGLSDDRTPGLAHDYTLVAAHYRTGFSAAGHERDNPGPNKAGSQRGFPGSATAI